MISATSEASVAIDYFVDGTLPSTRHLRQRLTKWKGWRRWEYYSRLSSIHVDLQSNVQCLLVALSCHWSIQ